ncbi:hypothetical protein C8R45DRAFT_947571 [Mycena sanguinolenta]|nr:hypothetical protein C8R45DRAFT_947571 [Mycena sanguinolenta]
MCHGTIISVLVMVRSNHVRGIKLNTESNSHIQHSYSGWCVHGAPDIKCSITSIETLSTGWGSTIRGAVRGAVEHGKYSRGGMFGHLVLYYLTCLSVNRQKGLNFIIVPPSSQPVQGKHLEAAFELLAPPLWNAASGLLATNTLILSAFSLGLVSHPFSILPTFSHLPNFALYNSVAHFPYRLLNHSTLPDHQPLTLNLPLGP